MTRLTATGLRKGYRGRQVVREVALEIGAGEIVGLLGPNGAGKTTCFYMLMGLIPPDAGCVRLDNRDITYAPMHQRARAGLGYLAQEPSVFRRLSVADNLRAVLELQRGLDKAARERRVRSLLDEFGLAELRDSRAMALSGGERRRLEIARALASEPAFILLDEPFAGVDPISVLEIQRLVRDLAARDIGVLITDHNVRETLSICARGYILNAGQVLAAGPPDDLLADEAVRAVYLGADFRL